MARKSSTVIEAPATVTETTEVKRARGRPRIYFTPEEQKAAATLAVKRSQAKKLQEQKDFLELVAGNARLSKAVRETATSIAARITIPKITL